MSWREQHDPEAVQHLGRGRIERRQVLDVGEPERRDVAGLRERRGPRQVVPERVERPRRPRRRTGASEPTHSATTVTAATTAMPAPAIAGPPRSVARRRGAWPTRPVRRRARRRPVPRPRAAATIGPSANQPTVPSTSRIAINIASATTASASRASAPVQSVSHRRRIATAPSPSERSRSRSARPLPARSARRSSRSGRNPAEGAGSLGYAWTRSDDRQKTRTSSPHWRPSVSPWRSPAAAEAARRTSPPRPGAARRRGQRSSRRCASATAAPTRTARSRWS